MAMSSDSTSHDGHDAQSILNHPPKRLPGPRLLHHLVQKSPKDQGSSAIDFLASDGSRRSLSYQEFHDASDALAFQISELAGIQSDLRPFIVPVLVPQGPELYVALLAVLKAGGAFCPLNLDIPPERAKLILDDTAAKVIITTSNLVPRLPPPETCGAVIVVDREENGKGYAPASDDRRHRQPQPDDLAYVMYTSGSTGTPKGVGISHEAATQSLLGHDRFIPGFSRFLQFAAPTFDVSVFEIFFPFFRGQTLVSCVRSAMLDDLPAVLRLMDVDACELTPSVAGSLLRNRGNAPNLRLLLTIGEMLTEPVVREFGGDVGQLSMLWGMYGPTEAAIHCTVQPAFDSNSATSNIGVPFDTVSAFIIPAQEDGKPQEVDFRVLPLGEVGELALGGYQVAQGYINRPEQTAKAFIDTPFGRLYRTGDKARMHLDGTLECMGRIGFGQVKLRGQRIELGEIEHAALRTPGCHGAFAATIFNTLVLFCAVDKRDGMAAAIIETCKQWLPGFMVPGDIVVANDFPRLPSGKVDRKRLAADYSANLEAGASPDIGRFEDDLERQLCQLASQVLRTEVLPESKLSHLGMDSLVAIRLASTLRSANIDTSALDILLSRSVSALHKRILKNREIIPQDFKPLQKIDVRTIADQSPKLRGCAEDIEAVVQCTPLQASMLAETAADPRAYCNRAELSFPVECDESAILSWFLHVALSNEALRTGFIYHEGQFLQIIFKALNQDQLVASDSPAQESHDDEVRADYLLRPFRVRIHRFGQDRSTIVDVFLHHAMYDGWSMDMLLSDLRTLARGLKPNPRPPFRLLLDYYRSSQFQMDRNNAMLFWAEQLVGFQPPTFPQVSVENGIATSGNISVEVAIDVRPTAARECAQQMHCGIQTLFQAALVWLWSSFLGTDEVVVGIVTSGRTLPILGIENIIGPCIASLPIKTNLSQVRTIRDLLSSVNSTTRAALSHSSLPLSDMKKAAGIRSGQPLYDALLVYQESLLEVAAETGDIREISHMDYLETKLMVEVRPEKDSFVCKFTSRFDVFSEDYLHALGASLRAVVQHMLHHPDLSLGTVRNAFPSNILSVYNPKPNSFAGIPDLAYAFEEIAASDPDRDAICFAEEITDGAMTTTAVTFDGLNKMANKIAWNLRSLGVREGDVVAIVMEKSVLSYAGILGILKAGGTCLPLTLGMLSPQLSATLELASVKVCLVDKAACIHWGGQSADLVLNLQANDFQQYPDTNPQNTPDPSRLAFMVFTSGSTGMPKGVCITQLNILSNLDVLSKRHPAQSGSRLLQSCCPGFGVSLFEMFFAWTQGICLCSATNDTLFEDLERSIRKLNITHLILNPSLASLVDPSKVPTVDCLITVGEAMTGQVADRWAEQLYQGYGSAEMTNICILHNPGRNQSVTHLGWPFENTSTIVLDLHSDDAVPVGCFGEFCFGGEQVAQGYLGLPELTSAKFINHPIYGRLYRSGDLGRMFPGGSMMLDGRVDDLVEIRGRRVVLTEITSAVKQSKSVVDCVTFPLQRDDEGIYDTTVTFFVPSSITGRAFQVLELGDGLKLQIQDIFQRLDSELPKYMVPSCLVPVSLLPTMLSGKLDRDRVIAAFKDLGEAELAFLSPITEDKLDIEEWPVVEVKVAKVISSVFGVDTNRIKRWTPLVTFGLDSISAIEVGRRLGDELGKRVKVSEILQNASVTKLAERLGAAPVAAAARRRIDLLPPTLVDAVSTAVVERGHVVDEVLPCTPLQVAMLAVSAGLEQYLNCMLLKIKGDVATFKEAWRSICRRQGILRTCFVSTSDIQLPIAQVVLRDWEAPWLEMDASESSLERCISANAENAPTPIDSFEPSLCFAVIQDNSDTYFSFACHHALYDGVAMERLLFEVEQTISGVEMSPPPTYRDFLQEALQLPPSTEEFWRRHLHSYQPKLLTRFDVPSPEQGSFTLTRRMHTPFSTITHQIRELGASLLALTQATWATVLACFFRTPDVCFGNVLSGRSLPLQRLDELVAPCFNTIPVRVDISDSRQRVDLIKAFQLLTPELLTHQFTPLRHIQPLISREQGGHLFDTLLLLQQPPRALDQSIWSLERDDGEMDVPIVCEIIPDTYHDLLVAKLHIGGNQLPISLAEVILELFSYTLEQFLQFPASSIPSLETIPAQLQSVLASLPMKAAPVSDSQLLEQNGAELWTPAEVSIRDVLALFSPVSIDRISRQTTIYQLGLDSISAVQVASVLRKQGHLVSASDVIDNPTCEQLAQHLERHDGRPSQTQPTFSLSKFQARIAPQIERQGINTESLVDILPCTPLQSGIMAQFIKSGGRDYFNFIEFRVDESITAAELVEAWHKLRRAHSVLRTGVLPAEDDIFPFVMIQHQPDDDAFSASRITENENDFDVHRWQSEAREEALRNPQEGLWKVVVVGAMGQLSMHLAIHHVLYDAHSLRVLLTDLAEAIKGSEVTLPLTIRTSVMDILGQVSTAEDKAEAFWKSFSNKVVINGFPVMTPLRENTRDISTHSVTSKISFTRLETAASVSGYPLQTIFQAAWTRVLSAYLGELSVTFGVVFSGRTTDGTQTAVFPCITTLPVISTNLASNRALLDEMLRYNTELYKQQHQPLSRIQQWLGHPDSRLFDTLLVYQKFDLNAPEAVPWTIVKDQATVDFPVSIEIEPLGNGVLGYQMTHFSDIIPMEQAELMLAQFDAIVRGLVLHPDSDEAGLCKSSPELFSVLPAETPILPTDVQVLHHFVEAQALSTPTRPALLFVEGFVGDVPNTRSWTYEELNANGNRVANAITPYIKVGDIVAVDFEKCPEAYFSILGILKAGCAFVALDPGAPAARKQFILEDSKASVLLTTGSDRDSVESQVSVPVLRVDQEFLQSLPSHPPITNREVEPGDVCYCLYTSGTTGVPKGCEITHDNAVQCMLAFQAIFEGHWDATSRWLQFASLHFDVSVLEQYWSWSVGITVVAAPRDLILEDLAGTISRLQITHIDLTPSLARLIRPEDVPSLTRGVFITGGESLKQEILDAWGEKAVIYNFYGPTEATIGVTVYPRVPENGRSSNIGRQFPNVGAFVLKPGTDIPVLKGAVGELCVSGKLVGKGYLNRQDLTAERFPTLKQFGTRVYRTGDLVRALHDNCFDFLGRADDQVKLRGQRLEIGEINHVIKTVIDTIQDVATLVVRNEEKQKDFLVSFVVAERSIDWRREIGQLHIVQTRESSDLCRRVRQACRSKLPGYMVPTYVFQLPFIPLSPSNKAEVKQLRTLFNSLTQDELVSLSSTAEGSPVQLGETGKKIVSVVASMQKLDPTAVSSDSSIFELGVDSISALRLSRELKRQGFPNASPATVLKYPVIGDLAHMLEVPRLARTSNSATTAWQLIRACAHRHKSHVCKELAITPDQIEYIAPCSPLQQGMISQFAAHGAYFNTFHFKLNENTNVELLRNAWQEVVNTTPILRTQFVNTVDGFVQVSLKDVMERWEVTTIAHGQELERVLADRRHTWISQNQDCITRPWEVHIVSDDNEGDDRTSSLILHIFHGLYDANSFVLMIKKIELAYLAASSHTNGFLPKFDGPSFLEALCHGPLQDFTSSKAFWTEHLRDVTSSHVRQVSNASHSRLSISNQQLSFDGLEPLRSKIGVTHQAIVQAAWVWALAKHTSSNPTIGMITSGRAIDLEGADNVIGPLFNTLPFHARIRPPGVFDAAPSWSGLIKMCHEFNTSALAFQHTPLRNIQKWCSPGEPLFDTLFSFQRENSEDEAGSALWTEVASDFDAVYPLALEATLIDGSLRLVLVAQDESSDSNRLSVLMGELEVAMRSMENNIMAPIWPDIQTLTTNGTDNLPNGQHAESGPHEEEKESRFIWSEDAMAIRQEIALLASVSPATVTETTSILELGLDSIDMIKLSSRLKRRGIKVKPSQLMVGQTITKLSRLLESLPVNGYSMVNGHSTPNTDLLRENLQSAGHDFSGVEAVFPTTPLQDSMIVEMIHSDFKLYFNHDILEIAPDVDRGRLKEAWQIVIDGSPILRTTFLMVENLEFDYAYCQLVQKQARYYIAEVNLDSVDDLSKITDVATHRARKAGGRHSLLQLVFATVHDRSFLVLSIAHALYDGWSLSLLHQDVKAAYQGRYSTRPPYDTHIKEIGAMDLTKASDFWSGFLEGSTATILPETADLGEGAVFRKEASSVTTSKSVREFCKTHAVTLQALGQACWAAVLAHRTGLLDVTFGMVLSGRDSEAAESLLFPTMNTVAMRSVIHGTVASWLRYMQDNAANASSFQGFPLRKAQKLVKGVTGPLFNTLFIQQRELPGENSEDQLMQSVQGAASVEYPVCVEMEVSGENVTWRTACSGRYVSEEGAALLLQHVDLVLEHFLRHPDSQVLELSASGVSVCGLPPFSLERSEEGLGPTTNALTNGLASNADREASPLEEEIRVVVGQVSGVSISSVHLDHSIYHLGLDSISAVKAISLLRKRGVRLHFRDMLRAKSISEMAELSIATDSSLQSDGEVHQDAEKAVGHALRSVEVSLALEKLGLDADAVEEVLPATAMQVHMLSVWQNTAGAVFFPTFKFRLSPSVDAALLTSAWETLVSETPILRTNFVSTTSREVPILQVIRKSTGFAGGGRYASLDLHQTADGGPVLQLTIHHALYDAVSLPALLRRFAARFSGNHESGHLVDEMLRWKNLVAARFQGSDKESRQQFWTDYLTGCKPSVTIEETLEESGNSRVALLRRDAISDISGIRSVCNKRGVSIQALFFAAYATFLATMPARIEAAPSRDVVFGIYLANRAGEDGAAELGYPTLCLVPLRVHMEPGDGIPDIATRIQQDLHVISSPSNINVGLWEIMDWTGVTVDSFVNFLSVPHHVQDETKGYDDSVQLEEVKDEATYGVTLANGFSVPPELEGDLVRDAYPDAVDIEVSIHGETETMTIGVFGSRRKLGEQRAKQFVDGISKAVLDAGVGWGV